MRLVSLPLENRKAWHDYEITDTVEAGVVLTGAEVKAIRTGKANFKGSYVQFLGGRPAVVGMHIGLYPQAGRSTLYNPTRTRYLLLKQSEIKRLQGLQSQKGVTLVPLKLYLREDRLKMAIGVARGKKQYDKREALRRRQQEREAARELRAKA